MRLTTRCYLGLLQAMYVVYCNLFHRFAVKVQYNVSVQCRKKGKSTPQVFRGGALWGVIGCGICVRLQHTHLQPSAAKT